MATQKTSVIIPAAQNEPHLAKTVDDVFNNARGPIEVIVVLDGYWPAADAHPAERDGLVMIHHGEQRGMRAAINTGALAATGQLLMKCDAHCAFAPGFDEFMAGDCKTDWVMVPVRYALDVDKWEPKVHRAHEFQYIDYETLKGRNWPEYADRVKRGEKLIDLMTTQGSCWFMHKTHFIETMGGLDENGHGGMGREAQEVCLKTWLSGGRFVLTRRTWYAHWNKPKKYVVRGQGKQKSVDAAIKMWKGGEWPGTKRSLDWLVAKFAPVPGWPDAEPKSATPPKGNEVVSVNNDFSDIIADTGERNNKPRGMNTERYIFEKYGVDRDTKSPFMIKGMNRAGLYRLFAELNYTRGCEVGVQRGRNAAVLLQNIPSLERLYLVEPYADHPSNRRKWGEDNHAKFRKQAHNRLDKDYGNVVQWVEGFSELVAHKIPDRSLHFVYIDGEHTYDWVMIDIALWHRKIRKGGILCGHDFLYKKPKQAKVARAVTDWCAAYRFSPIFITDPTARERPGDTCPSWFYVNHRRYLPRQ